MTVETGDPAAGDAATRPLAPGPAAPPARARRPRLAALRRGLGIAGWRARLAALQLLAPRAADRVALDLWCTLPPGAGSTARDRRPGAGERHEVRAPRGGLAVAEVWGAGPTVLLVHGWGGWRGQLGAFVAPLVGAGHRVVALDAPGHGDAGPGFLGQGRGTLVELTDAVLAVAAALGPVDAVVAHSLGCTAAALAIDAGVPVRSAVLIAPNPGLDGLLAEFSGALGLGRRAREHLRGALEEYLERPIGEVDVRHLAPPAGAVDTLVVHDRADRRTPHAAGQAVAQAWPDATLTSTDGLGHERVLADPEVVRAVVAHVTRGSRRVAAG